jgi:hypothetical protein
MIFVDRVSLMQVFVSVLQFSPAIIILPMLCTHLSSESGTAECILEYFIRFITFYILGSYSFALWSYIPASHLDYNPCNIELICYKLTF